MYVVVLNGAYPGNESDVQELRELQEKVSQPEAAMP